MLILWVADCCTNKGGGGGPSPGSRLDKVRLPRPWAEPPVDFEARLKYSQSYHRHPLIWAEPPWGPQLWNKGGLLPSAEKENALGFFLFKRKPLLLWQALIHPWAGFLKIPTTRTPSTPWAFFCCRFFPPLFFFFIPHPPLKGKRTWVLRWPRVE